MKFSLPRSLKISKLRQIGESPSRWLMAEESTWKIQIIRESALCALLTTIIIITFVERKTFFVRRL